MFSGCSAITTLDISNFDISKVEDMNSMFRSTKNIFDLAGNVYEWSLEACNTYYRTRRGGYFLDTNAYATRPDDRNSYCPTDSISYDGSRLTLY